jgi:1-deoxy-D-xylulose-5-phosphate synthase
VSLLDKIRSPADLRALPAEALKQVTDEVRERIVDVVSGHKGAHFGSNLGTVELTVALHRVFDTPRDQLIWDVGHQAYPHKILTGRNQEMPGIRRKGGLSGFLVGMNPSTTSSARDTRRPPSPRRVESPPRVTCGARTSR